MPIPDRQRTTCSDLRFNYLQTDDGSWTLEEIGTGNTFHSGCGAVTECLEVYAKNSGVAFLLEQRRRTRVLELGFGTGLAFAVTASLAVAHQAQLEYVAFEKRPLKADISSTVLQRSQHVPPLDGNLMETISRELFAWDENGWRSPQEILLGGDTIHLTIHKADIRNAEISRQSVSSISSESTTDTLYDAIYFDPFDPSTDVDVWTPETYLQLYNALIAGGSLVSYCVKSEVRRELGSVGFEVSRVPGPKGGKREVLVAKKPSL